MSDETFDSPTTWHELTPAESEALTRQVLGTVMGDVIARWQDENPLAPPWGYWQPFTMPQPRRRRRRARR